MAYENDSVSELLKDLYLLHNPSPSDPKKEAIYNYFAARLPITASSVENWNKKRPDYGYPNGHIPEEYRKLIIYAFNLPPDGELTRRLTLLSNKYLDLETLNALPMLINPVTGETIDPRAGKLIAALVHDAQPGDGIPLTEAQLADAIGVGRSMVPPWVTGTQAVYNLCYPKLVAALKLKKGDPYWQILTEAMIPYLDLKILDAVTPVLSPKNVDRRAGLLLAALRTERGLEQQEFAQWLGMNNEVLGHLERASRKIIPHVLTRIINAFEEHKAPLDDIHRKKLIALINPYLDPETVSAAQPPHIRLGLFVNALREARGVTLENMARDAKFRDADAIRTLEAGMYVPITTQQIRKGLGIESEEYDRDALFISNLIKLHDNGLPHYVVKDVIEEVKSTYGIKETEQFFKTVGIRSQLGKWNAAYAIPIDDVKKIIATFQIPSDSDLHAKLMAIAYSPLPSPTLGPAASGVSLVEQERGSQER